MPTDYTIIAHQGNTVFLLYVGKLEDKHVLSPDDMGCVLDLDAKRLVAPLPLGSLLELLS